VNFQLHEEDKNQHSKLLKGAEPEPEVYKKTSSITTVNRRMDSPSISNNDISGPNQQNFLILHQNEASGTDAEELISEKSKSSS